MSLLNSLTRLTWLSPTAELDDTRLASLRLGADMMVTSVVVQSKGPLGMYITCSCAVKKQAETSGSLHVYQHIVA